MCGVFTFHSFCREERAKAVSGTLLSCLQDYTGSKRTATVALRFALEQKLPLSLAVQDGKITSL